MKASLSIFLTFALNAAVSDGSDLLNGTIAIGPVAGKDCHPLDYLAVIPTTSELSIE